jgi:hypothetical protein
MAEIQKIRFKFPNGEEFEAEGSLEFIESQRNYFFALLETKRRLSQTASALAPQTPKMAEKEPAERLIRPHLWEDLLRQEQDLLALRKKHKITAVQAAFVIVAGAKMVLGKDSYSALELSRSLKLSGFETGRLDRLLKGEVSIGRLQAGGAKRSRAYQLTPQGMAHATLLAQKLINQ